MASPSAERLKEELQGAYGAYGHTSEGDPAWQANIEEVRAMIEQIPEMLDKMDPEEMQELAEALEVEGVDLEDLDIPGLEDLDPELLKDPEFREALELALEEIEDPELEEAELEEVAPEEQVIAMGMTLGELEAYRDALAQEAEAFRVQQEQDTAKQLENEKIANSAEAAVIHGPNEGIEANAQQAETKTLEAWLNNDHAAQNDTLREDRDGAANEVDRQIASVPSTPSGPFGT